MITYNGAQYSTTNFTSFDATPEIATGVLTEDPATAVTFTDLDETSQSALDSRKEPINPVNMKNITVSVDDEVYHRARVRAAELRTSVSALVRKALEELAGEETESERSKRLEREVLARLQARGSRFTASDRLRRDDLHNRNALR